MFVVKLPSQWYFLIEKYQADKDTLFALVLSFTHTKSDIERLVTEK